MTRIILLALLVVSLAIALLAGCGSDGDGDSDEADIEGVLMTYAWSMDSLDKETWLSVFSDDLEGYTVYHYDAESGDEVPVLEVPVPPDHALYADIGGLSAKEQLAHLSDMMIFERIIVAQSYLSNIVVEVDGDTAVGRDYFTHWEIVDPSHVASIYQGMDGEHWYFQNGRHEHQLVEDDGGWKIVRFTGWLLKSEARERQDL
jgi:hypothetical protein